MRYVYIYIYIFIYMFEYSRTKSVFDKCIIDLLPYFVSVNESLKNLRNMSIRKIIRNNKSKLMFQ